MISPRYAPNFYDYRLRDIECCGCTSYDYKVDLASDRLISPHLARLIVPPHLLTSFYPLTSPL